MSRGVSGFLFAALFFGAANAFSQTRAEDLFWEAWLKILHYERSGSDHYSGQVASSDYYLSSKGLSDPRGELTEDIRRMNLPFDATSSSPVCRFPARYLFLKKFGLVQTLDLNRCKDYEAFFKENRGEQVYLVFASNLIHYPSSAFGHMLLRIHKNLRSEPSELLDSAVNFGAQVDTENPLSYLVYGTFGGFSAQHSVAPYYLLVRTYSQMESRDIWSYPVKMSQEQIDLLVAHLWEMTHFRFRYYFFTQNCAYHLVSVLEAVSSIRVLSDRALYVLPSRVIQDLNDAGYLGNPSYRPSLRTRVKELATVLDSRERDAFDNSKNSSPPELSHRAAVFALTFMDYKYGSQVSGSGAIADEKYKLLTSGAAPASPDDLSLPLSSSGENFRGRDPLLMPREKRLGLLAYGGPTGQNGLQASHRFALFDSLDYDAHRSTLDEVDVMDFSVRLERSAGLRLQELSLIRLSSRPDFRWPLWELSWSAALQSVSFNSSELADGGTARTSGVNASVGMTRYEWGRRIAFWHKLQVFSGVQSHADESGISLNMKYAVGTRLRLGAYAFDATLNRSILKLPASVTFQGVLMRLGYRPSSRWMYFSQAGNSLQRLTSSEIGAGILVNY